MGQVTIGNLRALEDHNLGFGVNYGLNELLKVQT